MTKLIKSDYFLCIIILISILFIDSRADLLNCFFNVDIPFNYIAILIIVIMFITLLMKKRIKMDAIGMSLCIGLFYYIIQFVMVGGYDSGLFYFIDIFASICTYIYFCNNISRPSNTTQIKMLLISSSILSLQVVLTRLILFLQQVSSFQIKGFLQIPLGGSNYIASFLLLFFIVLFLVPIHDTRLKKGRIFTLFLVFFSLLLTESEGALLALGIYLLLLFGFKKRKLLFEHRIWRMYKDKIKIITIVLLLLCLVGFIFAIYNIPNDKMAQISSGRSFIYSKYIEAIQLKPLFGWGFYFEQLIGDLAHNWILSYLLYGGLFGLIIAVLPFIYLFYQIFIKKIRNINITISFSLFFVALLHGIFEPNLSTIKFDFIFWMLLAMLLKNNLPQVNIERNILLQNFSVFKRKLKLKNTLFVSLSILLFTSFTYYQYKNISLHHINMYKVNVTAHDLSKVDVYSLDSNKNSAYNNNILKLIKYSDLKSELYKQFSSELSYDDILNAVSIRVDGVNSDIILNVSHTDKELSRKIADNLMVNIKKVIHNNNSKDIIKISKSEFSEKKLFTFLISIIFQLFILFCFILIIVTYLRSKLGRGKIE